VKSTVIAVALAAVAAAVYGNRLEFAPPHVQIDEVLIGLVAHSIATTGRDLRGEFLPLYSQTAETSWYQPFVIYLTAATLKVLPFAEWSIRVPTVVLATLNIVLSFFVARLLFGSLWLGVAAATLLMLTPGHFIHTRYGMDYVYPVTFILGWLWCLARYHQQREQRWLVAAVVVLGVGFYCYISSIVMMPLYLGLTMLVMYVGGAPARQYALAVAVFTALVLPFIIWFLTHPAAYSATVAKYGLYDTQTVSGWQAMRSALGYVAVAQRVSQYWQFFNPAFLFFGSGTKVQFSTNLAGVFLLPTAVLLVIGVAQAVQRWREPMTGVLLIGFFTAPLAALIVPEENAIFRALGLLPFGVLLATLGLRFLSRQPKARWAAIVLLALVPLQFSSFWRDYFSDYRTRVAYWLGGNMREPLEEMIAHADSGDVPAIYFSTLQSTSGNVDGRNQYVPYYWKFYQTKHNRLQLLERTRDFDSEVVEAIPRGSLVFANIGNVTTDKLVASGDLTVLESVRELNGTEFFQVLQR
jgi:4-amino-4-deoxy-L-arabinose transferase-like glycosyltransferase